ncbi:hypothetical protein GCM10028792_40390 [Salinisphaera aquimarina]
MRLLSRRITPAANSTYADRDLERATAGLGFYPASYDGTARMLADNINRYARREAPAYVANAPGTLR